MKSSLSLVAIVFTLSCSISQAASLRIKSDPGSEVYSIFLNGEEENGKFETILVNITPDSLGTKFGNIDPDGFDGVIPRLPGDSFTYINPFLAAPPTFGGVGFQYLAPPSPSVPAVAESRVEFFTGRIGYGLTINTESLPNVGSNGLFLANILLENGVGTARVELLRGGNVVSDLRETFGVPEPSCLLSLVWGSMLVLYHSRRHRVSH